MKSGILYPDYLGIILTICVKLTSKISFRTMLNLGDVGSPLRDKYDWSASLNPRSEYTWPYEWLTDLYRES
jgi:hypothetical protein